MGWRRYVQYSRLGELEVNATELSILNRGGIKQDTLVGYVKVAYTLFHVMAIHSLGRIGCA